MRHSPVSPEKDSMKASILLTGTSYFKLLLQTFHGVCHRIGSLAALKALTISVGDSDYYDSYIFPRDERPYSYNSLYAEQPRTILNDLLASLSRVQGLFSLDLQDEFSDLELDRQGSAHSPCQDFPCFPSSSHILAMLILYMHITTHQVN